jgi:hypothetical protein
MNGLFSELEGAVAQPGHAQRPVAQRPVAQRPVAQRPQPQRRARLHAIELRIESISEGRFS